NVGAAQIVKLAAGRHASSRDVDQKAAEVRPCLHISGPLVDAIRPKRTRINVAGYPIQQAERGTIAGAGGAGMNVDEARCHDLAARIDRFGGVARNALGDGGDAAGGNGDVADSIDSKRRVDDAPALDD